MSWSTHLNPAPWRDQDENRRMAVQQEPVSGVSAALRANFPVAPMPLELQSILDKLR